MQRNARPAKSEKRPIRMRDSNLNSTARSTARRPSGGVCVGDVDFAGCNRLPGSVRVVSDGVDYVGVRTFAENQSVEGVAGPVTIVTKRPVHNRTAHSLFGRIPDAYVCVQKHDQLNKTSDKDDDENDAKGELDGGLSQFVFPRGHRSDFSLHVDQFITRISVER